MNMSILRSRSALDLYEFFSGVYRRRKWGGWDFTRSDIPSFDAQVARGAHYFGLHAVAKCFCTNSLSVILVFIQYCIGKMG